MFRIGKNGELRFHRANGTTARYGVRVRDGEIQFFDQLTRQWYKYKSGEDIPGPNGKIARLVVEWV